MRSDVRYRARTYDLSGGKTTLFYLFEIIRKTEVNCEASLPQTVSLSSVPSGHVESVDVPETTKLLVSLPLHTLIFLANSAIGKHFKEAHGSLAHFNEGQTIRIRIRTV